MDGMYVPYTYSIESQSVQYILNPKGFMYQGVKVGVKNSTYTNNLSKNSLVLHSSIHSLCVMKRRSALKFNFETNEAHNLSYDFKCCKKIK